MRALRTFRCQPCDTAVELLDERDDDQFAVFALRSWRCPGCRMHVHGRPSPGPGTGVSGIPLWLAEQFWTTARVHDDPALREHLYAITRAALFDAAETPADSPAAQATAPTDSAARHASAILLRVVQALRSPAVPPHPLFVRLLTAIDTDGPAGLATLWRPFVETPYPDRIDVTFMVRPPTRAGMFAFEYRLTSAPHLHTCYTVWRSLPDHPPFAPPSD